MNEKGLTIMENVEYLEILENIKKAYKISRLKATICVNSEMLKFYYNLGKEIVSLHVESKWGSGFYNKLSTDLKKEIPNIKGFSVTNLKYMKKFYEMYSRLNRPQDVDDLNMIFKIPWGHQRYIIDNCKGNLEKAIFL